MLRGIPFERVLELSPPPFSLTFSTKEVDVAYVGVKDQQSKRL